MLPIPFSNPRTYAGHSGVDFPQATGKPVKAGGSGVVVARGYTSRAGYYVRVKYDSIGRTVLSCHFPSLGAVPPVGKRVSEGVVVGSVGNTGNSTGPHLHQEVDGAATTAGYWRFHDSKRLVGAGAAPASAVGRVTVKRAVADVQRLVGAKPDGIYGADTTAKVRAWQKRNGLVADGIWGPSSDAKGFPKRPVPASGRRTVRRGAVGSDVKLLQQTLRRNYALYAGRLGIDGIFGAGTEKVVREFQRRAGLTVDGIVGPNTWKRLGL